MTVAALLLVLAASTCVAVSVPRITVLKCCENGEELSKPSDGVAPTCLPSENAWKPLIYSPSRKTMLAELPSFWSIATSARPNCSKSTALTYVPYSAYNPFVLLDVGNVILKVGADASLKPGEFCADSNALLACLPAGAPRSAQSAAVSSSSSSSSSSSTTTTTTTTKPRVHRCCGEDAAFDERKNTCVSVTKESPDVPALLPNASSVEMVSGFPSCQRSDNFTLVGDASTAALQPDGGLEVDGIRLPSGGYCVERIKGLDVAKVFACSEHAPRVPAIQAADIRFTLYPVGFIISVVFLAATLAAGWLLPASHHVLHWRCQTHHVACLMFGDLLMVVIQLAGDSLEGESCKALAIMAHFFFLAAFFWLNTMCFNIWWTFRDLRPASLEKGQETLRLRVYACYAWGGPLLIAGLAALLDHLPSEFQDRFLRPRFGEKNCWFYGDMEILAYFFGPIGALLAVNLLFFTATARELTCGLWKGEFVKSNTERAALGRVCMKLVVVMGVTWVADVVSWAIGGPQYLWYFTDLLNALQGVFIFAVVGCQPQVWAALKRFCNRNPRTNVGRQGNALSTTSHGILITGDSVTTQNPSTKTVPLETIC